MVSHIAEIVLIHDGAVWWAAVVLMYCVNTWWFKRCDFQWCHARWSCQCSQEAIYELQDADSFRYLY
jgi:hypothetical protein